MSVFVDTSAFLALMDGDDAGHPALKTAWAELVRNDARLWCTSYVVVETCALVQSRLGLEALRLYDEDVLPVVAIHWVAKSDHEAGMSAVLAANRKKLSLVDCVSFAVMRASGAKRALAVDSHFEEQGFEVIPKVG